MKLETLGRVWALLGAALLLGAGQFAAAPAQAQSCSDEEQIIWELLDTLGYALFTFDSTYDTTPSDKDCVNVCKKLANGCKRLGQSFAKDVNTFAKTGTSAAGVLCKTAVDRRACKAGVKEVKQLSKNLVRDLKAEFKQICADTDLTATCSDTCTLGELPGCCEEAFGGSCF
jgi:hypothetical protein